MILIWEQFHSEYPSCCSVWRVWNIWHIWQKIKFIGIINLLKMLNYDVWKFLSKLMSTTLNRLLISWCSCLNHIRRLQNIHQCKQIRPILCSSYLYISVYDKLVLKKLEIRTSHFWKCLTGWTRTYMKSTGNNVCRLAGCGIDASHKRGFTDRSQTSSWGTNFNVPYSSHIATVYGRLFTLISTWKT